MKSIIYGTGKYFLDNAWLLPDDIEIVAFADSSKEKATSVSGKTFEGKKVLLPSEFSGIDYDNIFICTSNYNAINIFENLDAQGIDVTKVRFLSRIGVTDEEWKYSILPDHTIMSKIGDIQIHEKTRTDMDIIYEIFAEHSYAINIPKNSVVIDFGMNVGIASLYFAQNTNVEKVYGFEPFPNTYQMALDNFSLNNINIANKIIPQNIAVSNFDGVKSVAVVTNQPGWRNVFSNSDSSPKVDITFKDSAEVVNRIFQNEGNKNFILKCDTEGSEYQIFESLCKADLLQEFSSIVMEYHGSPKELLIELTDAGFRTYHTGTNMMGNIIAFHK